MTTHRVTASEFSRLVSRWEYLVDTTPRTDPKFKERVAKLEKLRAFQRQEYGDQVEQVDEAWKGHGG